MHLLLVLRVINKKFACTFEGNNITTHPRRSVFSDRHLDLRLQPAAGTASTSRVAPACRMNSANALRSRSSCCWRVSQCFRLVSHTNTQNSASRAPKTKLVTFLCSKRNLPDSVELYRLARPQARWYQLRVLPLVGSEYVCPQCIVRSLSHGEVKCHRRWTFPFVCQDLKSSQETPIVTIKLPDKKTCVQPFYVR